MTRRKGADAPENDASNAAAEQVPAGVQQQDAPPADPVEPPVVAVEPASAVEWPTTGGSFIRQPDGSLVPNEEG
jgi:hypothetical protein